MATSARTITSCGYTPPATSRKQRRRQSGQAAAIGRDARRAEQSARRAEKVRLGREHTDRCYLPPEGEPGPDALRAYRRLALQPHRATSEVLAGAYPFLADGGLGSEGVLIGHDSWSGAAFVFDPWVLYRHGVLTNPNMLLAGVIGRGSPPSPRAWPPARSPSDAGCTSRATQKANGRSSPTPSAGRSSH